MSKIYDTHFYDGKLIDIYKEYVKIDDELLKSISDDFDSTMDEIIKIGNEELTKKYLRNFNHITKTLISSKNTKENYDKSNDIKFEDIICRVWKFYKFLSSSDRFILLEQISDIANGKCPPGRAGPRLFQLYELNMLLTIEISKFTKDEIEKIENKVMEKIKEKSYILEPDEAIVYLMMFKKET
jgi:hypothetical protein